MLCAKGSCDYNSADHECLLPSRCPIGHTDKEAIELFMKYRNNPSKLHTDKLYMMEAYFKHVEKKKENASSFKDWLFDTIFLGDK